MQRLGTLGTGTLIVAGVLALPVIAVLASVFGGATEAWRHIAATLLPRYVWNTLLLAHGVGL
ncbi:MAG TPA: iron ABC transporter permease, partial [Burkholderiales bacterium]|nr:iron ABC transporter permease [Burkholderiales bacterium]